MVTLVDDDQAVLGDNIGHAVLAGQALDHGDVDLAGQFAFAGAKLTDGSLISTQEESNLGSPLVEQWLPVYQDQGAASALSDQIGTQHGLPETRRRDQHAGLVEEHGVCRLTLYAGQLPDDCRFNGGARDS